MSRPMTLLQMAGAPAEPPAWSESVLIVIDHQGEYQTGRLPLPGVEAAAAEIGRLLAAARHAGAPVIHVAHKGAAGGLFDREGPGGAFLAGIGPAQGETVVEKRLPNSFAGTTLEEELVKTGRKALVVAGFMTHMCVAATVRDALDRGYRSTVVAGATATRDLPEAAGGEGVVPAAALQQATLAALADRFAIVVPAADRIPG